MILCKLHSCSGVWACILQNFNGPWYEFKCKCKQNKLLSVRLGGSVEEQISLSHSLKINTSILENKFRFQETYLKMPDFCILLWLKSSIYILKSSVHSSLLHEWESSQGSLYFLWSKELFLQAVFPFDCLTYPQSILCQQTNCCYSQKISEKLPWYVVCWLMCLQIQVPTD